MAQGLPPLKTQGSQVLPARPSTTLWALRPAGALWNRLPSLSTAAQRAQFHMSRLNQSQAAQYALSSFSRFLRHLSRHNKNSFAHRALFLTAFVVYCPPDSLRGRLRTFWRLQARSPAIALPSTSFDRPETVKPLISLYTSPPWRSRQSAHQKRSLGLPRKLVSANALCRSSTSELGVNPSLAWPVYIILPDHPNDVYTGTPHYRCFCVAALHSASPPHELTFRPSFLAS